MYINSFMLFEILKAIHMTFDILKTFVLISVQKHTFKDYMKWIRSS